MHASVDTAAISEHLEELAGSDGAPNHRCRDLVLPDNISLSGWPNWRAV